MPVERKLFPPGPFGYISHSYLAVFLHDFLRLQPSLRPLAEGGTERNAPPCLVRAIADAPTPRVARLVRRALAGLPADALLLSLHVRQGDAAMGKEDPKIVDMNEEMSRSSDFTALREVTEKLQCAAKSLATLRKRAHPREVCVFVASDTALPRHDSPSPTRSPSRGSRRPTQAKANRPTLKQKSLPTSTA